MYFRKSNTQIKSMNPILRATGSTQCIATSDVATVTNIQNQVNSMVNNVNSMSIRPTPAVLNNFITATSNINSQIASVLALPRC
jgi:hypothetical protein